MGRSGALCVVLLAFGSSCADEGEAASERQEVLRKLEGISNRLDAIELELARSMAADPACGEGRGSLGIDFGLGAAPGDDDNGPPPPRTLSVELRGNKVFVGDREVSNDALTAALQASKRAHQNPTVNIRAEKDVEHADVVAVLEIVRRAGIKQIGLATHASDDADESAPWDAP